MHIVLTTNSPVWSLGKGKGAPSFYKTIALYSQKCEQVTLLTTEKDCDLSELKNVRIEQLPSLPILQTHALGGLPRLLNKFANFIIHQFIVMIALLRLNQKVDLLYAYEIGFVPGTKMAARWLRIPCVSRFQGTVLTDLVNPNVSLLKRGYKALKFLDQIVALRTTTDLLIMTNDGTRGQEVVDKLTYRKRHVLFVRNGVDLPEFDAAVEQVSAKLNSPRFCSVSRLQPWKRIDRSLRIFAHIKQYYPEATYVVCGDGTDLPKAKALAMELGVADAVDFKGSVSKDDIYDVMLSSDVFLSSYELSNLGNPLFEAIACQCLVVTLDNGDTAKLVKDGETGVISRESDYLDNASKVVELLKKPERLAQIKETAASALKTKFVTWHERMESEYQHVCTLI